MNSAEIEIVPIIIFLDSLATVQMVEREIESNHLLEPMLTIALSGGPINTIPSSASLLEKVAFSLRKP